MSIDQVRVMRNLGFIFALLFSGSAAAQEPALTSDAEEGKEASATAEEQADVRDNPADTKQMDEIVVTAQMRAQSLQEVPLSIQVIGAEEIRDRGMDSLNEMSFYIPSFNLGVADGGIGGSISMRGITSSNNRGMEPGVALVVDDIYYGRIEYTVDNFLDIEQIEILRGPQGTLFGKNSVTGAIVLRTADPNYEGWSVDAEMAAFLLYKGAAGSVAVNAPIIDDRLALRGAYRNHYAVLVDNVNTMQPDLETFQRKTVARGKVRFDFSPAMHTVLQFDMVSTLTVGAFTQQTAAAPEWVLINRAFDPEFETDGHDRKTSIDKAPRLYKDSKTFNGQLNWNVSGDWHLQYTGGWSQFDQGANGDIDFMPIPLLTTQADDTFTQYSHELRVVSPESLWNGRLNFVAGAYYFWSNFDGINRIGGLEGDDLSVVINQVLPIPVLQELANQGGLSGILAQPYSQDGTTMFFDQITEAAALYGQADFKILDNLILTAGLRFNYEAKEIDMERTFDQTGAVFQATIGSTEFETHLEREDTGVLPRLSLAYHLTDDIMLFATYGQGVKSGGYNANAGTESEAEFEEETSVTYEAGFKAEFFGGASRLNATAYITEVDEFQFSQFNGLEFVVENAGSVRAVGFEADGFTFLPYGFIAMGSLGYTDSKYTSFPNGPCRAGEDGPCDLTGKELAGAPKLSGSLGFGYMNQLGNLPFNLIVGFDAGYRGDSFLDSDLDPNTKQEAYTLYNSWLEIRGDDESWRITLRGENIFDEKYNTSHFDTPVASGGYTSIPGGRRTLTLSARVRI